MTKAMDYLWEVVPSVSTRFPTCRPGPGRLPYAVSLEHFFASMVSTINNGAGAALQQKVQQRQQENGVAEQRMCKFGEHTVAFPDSSKQPSPDFYHCSILCRNTLLQALFAQLCF